MILRTSMIFAAACSFSHAFVRSGQATVDWWSSTLAYKAGQPIETAIRMEIDQGWHTYWSNPGESGMKLSVEWSLPEGWTASDPAHPVPKRFLTGGLAGFGYEGVVFYPVTLVPPKDAEGPVTLSAKLSWLACDDSACIPGDAELTLNLTSGRPVETANARAILAASELVPTPLEAAKLTVVEEGGRLALTLDLPDDAPDLADSQVFPETLRAIDPAAPITFVKDGDVWVATTAKSEYAADPLEELVLVIAPKEGKPFSITWKRSK
jgi:DsbC/DsbD-like thiol-disulfide interchange protein